LPTIAEVLGISDTEYFTRYEQYTSELRGILQKHRSKTRVAEAILDWLDERDAVLKMIVIFDMIDRAAKLIETVSKFAKMLKKTEHRDIGELLENLIR